MRICEVTKKKGFYTIHKWRSKKKLLSIAIITIFAVLSNNCHKKMSVLDKPTSTVDIDMSSANVTIRNQRWEHKSRSKMEQTPDTAVYGDTIALMVDVTGLPEEHLFTFTIYGISTETPVVVDSVKNKTKAGVASSEWIVRDKSGKCYEKLAFRLIIKNKTSVMCEIPIKVTDRFTINLMIDPATPISADDQYVLLDDDDASKRIIKIVKDHKVAGASFIEIPFTGIVKEKKYSLVVDPGENGVPYFVFKGVEGASLICGGEISYSEE